jgi:hypothetical protein
MQKVTYISGGNDGHHADYDRLFIAIFSELGISANCVPDARQAQDSKALLFYAMLDSKPARTVPILLRTITRSLLGRPTAGLFFRPGECLSTRSLKYAIKRLLFRLAAHLPHASILTIVPFDVCPEFSKVATNGIYDPQLWDLHYLGLPAANAPPDLQGQIESAARGRRIVVALGSQNPGKGLPCLVEIWNSSPKVREEVFFVVAGKISADCRDEARLFRENDGLCIDRRIGDDELFSLYAMADMVWSCYSPQYDQASGIHGRAVQLGVPVIVREDSYLEKLGKTIDHPTLALPFDAPLQAADRLLAWRPFRPDETTRAATVETMREKSVAILAQAIR